ncbi:MAG: hypothetical protein H0X50_02820 [Nitrosopumilus sp.]|nr:hypothetical protein [Nitrosopumilus sp.]
MAPSCNNVNLQAAVTIGNNAIGQNISFIFYKFFKDALINNVILGRV